MNNLTGISAASNRPRGDKKPWTAKLALAIGGLIALAVVVYVSTNIFGRVSGEEFAPSTFERRTFTYFELPLIRYQVTPIKRESTTNSFERYLRRKKLISKATSAKGPARWDLVRSIQAHKGLINGDAEFLCSYLDAVDSQDNHVWEAWTEKNAEMGKILWAAVARLADQRLYLFVPDVFELAVETKDVSDFEKRLNQTLAARYQSLARTQKELGNLETARELAKEALRYDSTSPSIRPQSELNVLEVD